MNIRRAVETDFEAMWVIFQMVVSTGTTFAFSPETDRQAAFEYWFGNSVTSYVAEEENGPIVGMYRLIANQRDRGSHVANASFMVDLHYDRRGIGEKMGWHALREAKKAGYMAMQFNFVVSTNDRAVSLWKKIGFTIIGALPKAFLHRQLGYVDVYVMYRFLDDIK